MAWVKAERVRHALQNLDDWRKSVQDQGSRHLLPLLALLELNAGDHREVELNENPHEFAFWDKYFHIGGDTAKPYFNPLTLRRAEAGYPHSNTATIRKNTFANKWKAVTRREDGTRDHWTLAEDYASIFRDKVLTKAGEVSRVPVVDLAAVVLRLENIEPATAEGLVAAFRARFPMADDDYQKIFVFRAESPANIFTDQKPGPEMNKAIEDSLVAEVVPPSAAPAPMPAVKITDPDDELLTTVQQLLKIGTSGIILTGPPGTSKTRDAERVSRSLVDDPDQDIFHVQFHPSFGYEDFVEGYRPDEDKTSGFGIVPKIFLAACERARAVNGYVIVIVDEINRGDPARIFGELLTYLERGYRERPVRLPFSGTELRIPRNLLLIGTMNPFDRSVSHIDAAFVRRFDHIPMEPSRERLDTMLEENGFAQNQIEIIGKWFDEVQKMMTPVGLGHAIFADAKSVDDLKVIWRYRLRPTGESILDMNVQMKDGFVKSFEAMMRRLEGGEVA